MGSLSVPTHTSHVSWGTEHGVALKKMNHVKSLSSDTSSDNTEVMSLMDCQCRSNGASDSSSSTNPDSVKESAGSTPSVTISDADKNRTTFKKKIDLTSVPKELPSYEKTLEYFSWVETAPKHPPPYKSVNPNRRVRFPIYERIDDNVLPGYSPAVSEITVVSMKQEWMNPYELSTSRAWKNFIMEINSTQLNFYYIHDSLTSNIRKYYGGPTNFSNDPSSTKQSSRFLPSLHAKSTYQFNRADQEWLTKNIKNNKSKYMSDDMLFKTFSLQYAKIGIPTDYTKKTFVLRLRCEVQQFLINFAHVDDMIDWSVYLSIGINVSLDLAYREMPNYRTVPRRRRRSNRRRKRRKHKSEAIAASSLQPMLLVGSHNSASTFFRTAAQRYASDSSTSSLSEAQLRPLFASSRSTGVVPQIRGSPSKGSVSSRSTASVPMDNRTQRRSSDSNIKGLKSKIFTMFHHEKKSLPSRQRQNSNTSTLNCVIEDDTDGVSSPKDKPGSRNCDKSQKESILVVHSRSSSTPSATCYYDDKLLCNKQKPDPSLVPGRPKTVEGSSEEPECSGNHLPVSVIPDVDEVFSCENDLSTQRGFQNAIASRLDLNELQTVIDEHNFVDDEHDEEEYHQAGIDEIDGEEEGEADEEEEEEEDDDGEGDDTETVRESSSEGAVHRPSAASSIYDQEGIFHDSDDDYIYVPTGSHRDRSSSVTSNLSSTPYGSDERKWNPPRKEITRRRYIRDSLRCIKPLGFNDSWINKIALAPSTGPKFKTNNVPASGNVPCDNATKAMFSLKKLYTSQPALVLNKCKNHYLRPYIVTPSGLVRASGVIQGY